MRQGIDDLLAQILTDLVTIHKRDGRVFSNIKARVPDNETVYLTDVHLPVEVGDTVVRFLPNGLSQDFSVEDLAYRGPVMEVPACFKLTVRPVNRSRLSGAPSPFSSIDVVESEKPIPERIKRRRQIVKNYKSSKQLTTKLDLARNLGMSESAIDGMIRGDTTRFGSDTLSDFLKKIGVAPQDW